MPIIRRKKTIEGLAAEVAEMQTAIEAMWDIVKQKTGATEDDLDETIAQLSGLVKTKLESREVSGRSDLEALPTACVEGSAENPFVAEVEGNQKVEELVEAPPAEQEVVAVEHDELAEEVEVFSEEVVSEEIVSEEIVSEEVVSEEVVIDIEVAEEERETVHPVNATRVKLRGDRVKCPDCSKIFSVRDVRYWDGEKHTVCGTPLIVEGIEDLVF